MGVESLWSTQQLANAGEGGPPVLALCTQLYSESFALHQLLAALFCAGHLPA
jgi:hypothetical protein